MIYTNFVNRLNEILLTYRVSKLTNLNTAVFLRVESQKEILKYINSNPKDILPKEYNQLSDTMHSITQHAEDNEVSYDEVCDILTQLQMKQLTDGTIRLFHETISSFDGNHRSLKLKESLYHKRWYQMLDALYVTVAVTNPYHPVWKSWYFDEDVIRYGHIQIIKGQFRLEIIYHEADVLQLLTEGYKHMRSMYGDAIKGL